MFSYLKLIFQNIKNLNRNSFKHQVDLKRLSGRFGEEQVLQACQGWIKKRSSSSRNAKKSIRLFEQLRIPDTNKGRKSEIDAALLCGSTIMLIEVKNWGGTVESNDSGNFRQTPASGAKAINHPNPIKQLENKKHNLIQYLKKKGAPKIKVMTALVFVSENLEIYLTKKERNYCFFIPELLDFLDQRMHIEQIEPEVINCLEHLPTWDTVELYGGKILTGDIVGNRVLFAKGQKLDRRHHRNIEFFPVRKFWQILRIPHVKIKLFDRYFRKRLSCDMDQSLTLLQAGNSETTSIPLHDIHKIGLGWRNDEYRRKPVSEYVERWFTGRVVAVESYGVFVQLDDMETGLLHASVLESLKKDPVVGQRIKVYVNSSSKESHGKRRFELLLKNPSS